MLCKGEGIEVSSLIIKNQQFPTNLFVFTNSAHDSHQLLFTSGPFSFHSWNIKHKCHIWNLLLRWDPTGEILIFLQLTEKDFSPPVAPIRTKTIPFKSSRPSVKNLIHIDTHCSSPVAVSPASLNAGAAGRWNLVLLSLRLLQRLVRRWRRRSNIWLSQCEGITFASPISQVKLSFFNFKLLSLIGIPTLLKSLQAAKLSDISFTTSLSLNHRRRRCPQWLTDESLQQFP